MQEDLHFYFSVSKIICFACQWSQCDHPNLDLDTIDPVLLEEDIPGAKLDLDNLQQYVVPQLQFWLACRGLPQDGRKEQLITR